MKNQQNIELTKIRQIFKNNKINDLEKNIINELEKIDKSKLNNKRLAIAVGSRGINNLSRITRIVTDFLKQNGAKPFIFPAMGSHGGATDEGQKKVLHTLGIDEKTMNCPVISSMETIKTGETSKNVPLYMDKNAYHSDGIILINRIKPHTNFFGKYESGLLKMAVIGVGKQSQALDIHKHKTPGLKNHLPEAGKKILKNGKFLGGLALVEDAYDQTMITQWLNASEIIEKEPELLKTAYQNMPCLPCQHIRILIVDEMGKDISGVGMDTNIIGRIRIADHPEPDNPIIEQIIVNNLTDKTKGNATGVGLADMITKKLFQRINFETTYKNIYTSGNFERAKIPVIAKNMQEALSFASRGCFIPSDKLTGIVRIKNTLRLDEAYISKDLQDQCLCQYDIISDNHKLLNGDGELNVF